MVAKGTAQTIEDLAVAARPAADQALDAVLDALFPTFCQNFRVSFQAWAKDHEGEAADKFRYRMGIALVMSPTKEAGFQLVASAQHNVKHKAVSNAARIQLEFNLQSAA